MSAPLAALVVGAAGQLGSDLVRVLSATPTAAVTGLRRRELDVTDGSATPAAVAGWAHRARAIDPTARLVVFNAAAWTDVDGAEADEDGARAVNATAPGVLAAACADTGAALVHVSTDYVFAGDATTPYAEDAPPAPRSAYGRSKLAGERAVLAATPAAYVVRTAWLYGETGPNFVKTMARLARERETVSVVDDQRGAPTWAKHLAAGLVRLAGSDAPYGLYHCTNAGATTWYGLARAVFAELGADPDRVHPTTTAQFPRPAPRPAYSVLGDGVWRAAGLAPLPDWRSALSEAFSLVGDRLRAG